MKIKIILTTYLLLTMLNTFAQSRATTNIRGKNSNECNSVELEFVITDLSIKKYDSNSNLITEYPAHLVEADYDTNGNYMEYFTPKFVLDDYGVDSYRKIKKYIYQMVYNQKDGDLLYVFEYNLEQGPESGKYYFSKLGTSKYCK